MNSRFRANPWFHLLYFENNSTGLPYVHPAMVPPPPNAVLKMGSSSSSSSLFNIYCRAYRWGTEVRLSIISWCMALSKRDKNRGFDHCLRKLSSKSLLGCRVSKSIFFSWVNLLGPPLSTCKTLKEFGCKIRYAHGTRCPKSQIDLCKSYIFLSNEYGLTFELWVAITCIILIQITWLLSMQTKEYDIP